MEKLEIIILDQGIHVESTIIDDSYEKNYEYIIETYIEPEGEEAVKYTIHGLRENDSVGRQLDVVWQHSFQIPFVHEVIKDSMKRGHHEIIFFQPSSIDCLKQLIDCCKEVMFVVNSKADTTRLAKYMESYQTSEKVRKVVLTIDNNRMDWQDLQNILVCKHIVKNLRNYCANTTFEFHENETWEDVIKRMEEMI